MTQIKNPEERRSFLQTGQDAFNEMLYIQLEKQSYNEALWIIDSSKRFIKQYRISEK